MDDVLDWEKEVCYVKDVPVSIHTSTFHWDSLLLSLDTTAGFQWSPFPCLAVVSEALKERETKEWKGMLKCSWLAVELREWFASTRSTSRIHKMSRIIRLRVQPYERRALPCQAFVNFMDGISLFFKWSWHQEVLDSLFSISLFFLTRMLTFGTWTFRNKEEVFSPGPRKVNRLPVGRILSWNRQLL